LIILFLVLFDYVVPPERISIRDESNTERTSVVGPYSEGDTMKLKCDVFGGKPMPNLTWFRDGYPIFSESVVAPSGRYLRSEIEIERLNRQDLNSRFTCKAINHHRASALEASVQLDMNCKLLPVRNYALLKIYFFLFYPQSCSIKYSTVGSASTSFGRP